MAPPQTLMIALMLGFLESVGGCDASFLVQGAAIRMRGSAAGTRIGGKFWFPWSNYFCARPSVSISIRFDSATGESYTTAELAENACYERGKESIDVEGWAKH
jgi:hypothetical protein